jgi:xanthine dehydrogenase accessory factor
MTHSHAIDFDICDRILRRSDATYCGLIGSVSKRRRFEKRYREQGMLQAVINKLVCPIGIDGISGKKPAESISLTGLTCSRDGCISLPASRG